jgi:hypothetical protein
LRFLSCGKISPFTLSKNIIRQLSLTAISLIDDIDTDYYASIGDMTDEEDLVRDVDLPENLKGLKYVQHFKHLDRYEERKKFLDYVN